MPPLPSLSLPVAATGWRRALHRAADVALAGVPGPLRRALGWWRWHDILDRPWYQLWIENASLRETNVEGPVASLVRRGIPMPFRSRPDEEWIDWLPAEWHGFFGRERLGSFPSGTRGSEALAWLQVWRQRPGGAQPLLNHALLLTLQQGPLETAAVLLKAGADPFSSVRTGGQDKGQPIAVFWLRFMPFDVRLHHLRSFVDACPALAHDRGDATAGWRPGTLQSGQLRFNRSELEEWKSSGLPMPRETVALHLVCAWLVPPSGDFSDNGTVRDVVRWWKASGLLPTDAPARLLKFWLSTHSLKGYFSDREIEQISEELLLPSLPPRPGGGPVWNQSSPPFASIRLEGDLSMPWLHWALAGPHLGRLPSRAIDMLLGEPDVLTARNESGHTALDILSVQVEHDPSPPLLALQARLRAMERSRALEQALPEAATEASRGHTDVEPESRPRRHRL